MKSYDTDIIIVGGGIAGLSAAITASRLGINTVLLERGTACGTKNMFGGAIYTTPTLEVYPNFIEEAPLERGLTRHTYALLGQNDGTLISYDNPKTENDNYHAYSVFRPKWDRWCANQAEKAGAKIIPQILVNDLIEEDGYFCGIKTANEEFKAKITILADGANSLLARKNNLVKDIEPKNVAISVKQTLKLTEEKIQDRFNLDQNSGAVYTIMGASMLSQTGLGFLYTNRDTLSIGVGITLEDMKKTNKPPYEYLEELKNHPSIKPLVKDSEIIEYSAHLIPEGGYNAIPKLSHNGLMIVGDAASLVNNIHWEGTNLAMLSGKYAAIAATNAIRNNDYSHKSLASYDKMLKDSFIMKDLYSYRNLMSTIEENSKAFLGFYPTKVNEFMNTFTATDSIPKKQKYREFIIKTLKERNLLQLSSDGIKIAKLVGDALL